MKEQFNQSKEPMTAEQSFQALMLSRQILKLRISPDGYGMMETDRAVWRKQDSNQQSSGFEGIWVDDFQAFPNATALELGASPFNRESGEWNDYNFTEAGVQETAASRGEGVERGALAEISYWSTNNPELPSGEENPKIVYYYLGAEQMPTKTIEYLAEDNNTIVHEELQPTAEEANLVLADLANVLNIAQSQ